MSGLTDVFRDVVDCLNVLGSEKSRQEEIRNVFARTHRTLQQQFVKVIILPVLQELAEMDKRGWVDLRNQQAAMLATKMLAAVDEEDLYLPLV